MEKKVSHGLAHPLEADAKSQRTRYSHGRCPHAPAQPEKLLPVYGTGQWNKKRLLPFLCPGFMDNQKLFLI